MERECAACRRTGIELIHTHLFSMCEDAAECIAEFSGWNKPPEPEAKLEGSDGC